jgi:hypothetical protein
MTWRHRIDRLEARAPLPPAMLSSAERVARIEKLFRDADRPNATSEVRSVAARVREILALAERGADNSEGTHEL